jgi:hypothetical protein
MAYILILSIEVSQEKETILTKGPQGEANIDQF